MDNKKMPIIFVGHGSPMYGFYDNPYYPVWQKIASKIRKPKEILVISAHWFTMGNRISTSENPETIYDFRGFPSEMYDYKYEAKGTINTAKRVIELLGDEVVDWNRGFDHGAWCVLKAMYPNMDIPVTQMSVAGDSTPEEVFNVGKLLAPLRNEDVLIIGSGNIVHNLWKNVGDEDNEPFPFALEFDNYIYDEILDKNFENIISYEKIGDIAKESVPTKDHFYPLLYVLGAVDEDENVEMFNKDYPGKSISMTSYIFGL